MDPKAFTLQKLKTRRKDPTCMMAPPKPTDQNTAQPYAHSAAGHEGLLSSASGTVLIKPCQQSEIDFYTAASTSPAHALFYAHMPQFLGVLRENPEAQPFAPLLDSMGGAVGADAIPSSTTTTSARQPSAAPPQIGTLARPPTTTDISSKRSSWQPSGGKKLQTGLAIVMENATAGFQRPCVLDVKLGARLWADDAPASKRQKLDDVARETTSGSLGFRVAGMTVWRGSEDDSRANGNDAQKTKDGEKVVEYQDGYAKYNKHYGRAFTEESVAKAFDTYLGNGKHRKLVAERLTRELESIRFVLEEEESKMYSASILMVFEGDDEALDKALEWEKTKDVQANGDMGLEDQDHSDDDDEDDDEKVDPKVHDVRLIDFAHAKFTPGEGHDENSLRGVRSVLKIFKEIA